MDMIDGLSGEQSWDNQRTLIGTEFGYTFNTVQSVHDDLTIK